MHTKLFKFGNSIQRIKTAIHDLKHGKGIIILDSKNRENEGDLVFPAETMTVNQMALSIRYTSGIICLCITEKTRKRLNIPMMVKNNTSQYKTNFTVSIEAAHGVTTGVSAIDRIKTIKTAISKKSKPHDLNKPGHIFPLRAHINGIKSRQGHTESSLEIIKLAGFKKYSVIGELTNKNGTMSRIKDSIKFAKTHNMTIISIKDILNYLNQ
ncbi:3,4-dihydroxy-2-butanone 4-phosphate synthase [Buchnera aphidicola (Periphyllus testudinaceus)]|uniref:3,4-dihydroxy-2-butanone-4-phosphate synthase n=1 Tax=Buchnera aphidicola TaxID=9 RepID=UPI003463F807